MIIKVCGLREADNIRDVERLASPHWAGLIFYDKSPRYVCTPPDYLPACRRIGVFVNPDEADVWQHARDYGLWGVQTYGATPSLCRRLREGGLAVIVAIHAEGDLDRVTRPYMQCADYFLFDTPCETFGGSGRCFNHTLLNSYHGEVPFLLSGGLNAESVDAVLAVSHPKHCGIDLNSGFETAPARKDANLLKRFIDTIRASHA